MYLKERIHCNVVVFLFFFKSGFISKGHSQRAVNYIRQNETW